MPANVDKMAYVGQVPWHGLGAEIPANASIPQALKAASLNWTLERLPVEFTLNGERHSTTKRHVLVRSDTLEVFDTTGPQYTPFQNEEVVGFFSEYLAAGDMRIETLGSLNDGRDIWCLAKLNDGFTLGRKDRVEGYIFMMNPHRYGHAAVVKFTTIRIVCNNTLMMALHAGGDSVNLTHHMAFTSDRKYEAQERLGIAREQLASAKENAQRLAAQEMTRERAIAFVTDLFNGDKQEKELEKQPARVRRVIELFDGQAAGSQLSSAKDTAWGLLNAVTQYVDHEHGRSTNNRLTYSWLYGGGSLKNRALVGLLDEQRR